MGIRGSVKSIRYNIFANYKNISFRYSPDSDTEKVNRLYVGGNINYSKNKVNIDGESFESLAKEFSEIGRASCRERV